MFFIAFAAFTAGLVAHQGFFIYGEWHLRIRNVVATHIVLAGIALCLLNITLNSFIEALKALALVSGCYLISLFASISIYRLVFHPLYKFPGPRLAALTKFWHVYHARNSTNYLVMDRLHKKYGTFVRTGPNEITIFHPAGIDHLDGAKNTNTKDPFYDVLKPRMSAIFTRDEKEHKERRQAWTLSLSTKSMDVLRPRIAKQALLMQDCVKSYGTAPVNINDVMTWFSFDAMGEIVFGEEFGMLRNRATHPAIVDQHAALALLGPFIDTMWIVQLAFTFFPFLGKVRGWMNMVTFCEKQMAQRLQRAETERSTEKEEKLDMARWFIDEYYMLKGTRSQESRDLLLSGSAVSAVVAGSDTTRASLITIWWYLCKHPEHITKIQHEIKNVDATDANALALLPHLNGVLNETLRLLPPAMTGNGRITGSDGLLIDETLIPPFTKITAPKYVIQRMSCAFEQPNEFIPERWYSRPELIHDRRAFGPFSVGGRQCVGKVLAYTELRLCTAILLKQYNVEFAPKYDPDSMWRDLKDQVTAQPGEVICIFKPRELE